VWLDVLLLRLLLEGKHSEGSASDQHGLWRSLVSALDWGSRGRGFKSRQPDDEGADQRPNLGAGDARSVTTLCALRPPRRRSAAGIGYRPAPFARDWADVGEEPLGQVSLKAANA
jgi:hypothetical protein